MTQLLTTELRKIIPYRTFWVIMGIFAALLFLFLYGSSSIKINGQELGAKIYTFPDFWIKLTYTASYFNLLLGILLIILITDEYTFRTLRQQVIDGLFRHDVLNAKMLVIFLIGILATIIVFILGLGFGMPHNASSVWFSGSMHLVYYLVQAVGYMSVAMLIAFLVRKNGLAILAFLLYTSVIEPLIHWRLDDALDKYFPMKVFSSLTPNPTRELLDSITGPTQILSPQEAILPALVYIGIFYGLSYLVLKMRDL